MTSEELYELAGRLDMSRMVIDGGRYLMQPRSCETRRITKKPRQRWRADQGHGE